jgi:ABC-type antimicrobial peptide transport system permease subunit
MLLRFSPGTAEKSERKLRAFLAEQGCADPTCLLTDSRPAEIDGYRSARGLPAAIAVVLVLLLVATLTHVLVSTMRRRAADLAVLRAIGSSSRNLVATLRWQALVLTGSAILIGIPLGLIANRIAGTGSAPRSASPRDRHADPRAGRLRHRPARARVAAGNSRRIARPEHRSSSPFQRSVAPEKPTSRPLACSTMTQLVGAELTTSHVGLAVVCSVAAAFSYG